MVRTTFIFAKQTFNDHFHALDQAMAAAAKAIPGCLGDETWENPARCGRWVPWRRTGWGAW